MLAVIFLLTGLCGLFFTRGFGRVVGAILVIIGVALLIGVGAEFVSLINETLSPLYNLVG